MRICTNFDVLWWMEVSRECDRSEGNRTKKRLFSTCWLYRYSKNRKQNVEFEMLLTKYWWLYPKTNFPIDLSIFENSRDHCQGWKAFFWVQAGLTFFNTSKPHVIFQQLLTNFNLKMRNSVFSFQFSMGKVDDEVYLVSFPMNSTKTEFI